MIYLFEFQMMDEVIIQLRDYCKDLSIKCDSKVYLHRMWYNNRVLGYYLVCFNCDKLSWKPKGIAAEIGINSCSHYIET